MTRDRTVIVTITRTIDIDVTVRHVPGSAPTWWDPGEPDETLILSAFDHDGDPVELTETEEREAAHKAMNEPDEDPNPIQPEPDGLKPF